MNKTDEKTEAVQLMQDYIEKNLYDEITPAGLAAACHFSPWYAARLFKEGTGYTPGDYIRRLRLSISAKRLRDEKSRILDVALDLGYDSAEGYQRAFFREFGVNPREYAVSPVPLWLFTPYGVKYKKPKRSTDMAEVQNVFIRQIEKPARRVLIKRGLNAKEYWTYCQEVGCEVWGLLQSIKSPSGEPVCMWLPDRYVKPGTSVYVQGTELPDGYTAAVPEGFDVIELPQATYLEFRGEPFSEENYCDAIEALRTAVAKYDPHASGYEWDETNPRIQLEPIGTRGYTELLPVRKI